MHRSFSIRNPSGLRLGSTGRAGLTGTLLLLSTLLLGAAPLQAATAVMGMGVIELEHRVDPMHNLFHDDWGHPYVGVGSMQNPEPGGLGLGLAPLPVSLGGLAFDFASFDVVDISATGTVQDLATTRTGPGGAETPQDRFSFRDLLVYSLIGIWSSEADRINPIDPLASQPAFDIGASARLRIPDVPRAYLFLAENDGVFHDNLEGEYQVALAVSSVPLPAALVLFAGALGVLRALAGRRRPPY